MKRLPDDFLWFRMDMEQYDGHVYEMRTMFDISEKFSKYCLHSILSQNAMERNRGFDKGKFSIDQNISLLSDHLDNYDAASVLKNYYPDIDDGIYLFGAGEYGERFSRYLTTQKVRVKGNIDNSQDKHGGHVAGFRLFHLYR